MKLQKVISGLLSATILSGILVLPVSAEVQDVAYINFGRDMETKNADVKYGKNNSRYDLRTVPIEKGGRYGWNVSPIADWADTHLYINLRDSWVGKLKKNESYEIEVDYFDEGNGNFRVIYDAMPNPWDEKDVKNHLKRCDTVYLDNTMEWKTAKFLLDTPRFNNGYDEADLVVTINDKDMGISPAAVVFGAVRVKKAETKSSVQLNLSTDVPGHNFFGDDGVSFSMETYNLTDEEKDVMVKLKAYNHNGVLSWEDSFSKKLSANECVEDTLSFIPPERSVFDMYAEVSGEGIYSCKKVQFSYLQKPDKKNPIFGVNMHPLTYLERYEPEILFPIINQVGAGITRETIRWNMYEREKGVYAIQDKVAERIKMIKKHDLISMWVLASENGIYGPGWAYGEEMEAACLEYVRRIVTEYKGMIKYYEVFNEVASEFYEGRDANWYARLAKQITEIIREIDPEITIIYGATSEVPAAWIQKVCEMTKGYFDAFSIHPYSMKYSAMDANQYENVLTARAAMEAAGCGDIPLWITEIGWPTSYCTYEEQAASNTQFYAMMQRPELNVDRIFYYDMQDDGYNQYSQEDVFGLIRPWAEIETPFLAKPALVAAANMNKILTDAELLEWSICEGDDTVMYKFKRPDGKEVLMLWSYPENHRVTYSLGTDDVEIYDMYGTKLDIRPFEGKYTVNLDDRPMYIIGNFSNTQKCDAMFDMNGVEFNMPFGDTMELTVQKNISEEISVEVETAENSAITVKQNDGFAGNEAKIVLYSKGRAGKHESVSILLKNQNGELLSEIKVKINFVEPISLNFETKPFDSEKFGRWIGVATIKNNRHDRTISGKIVFNGPNEFKRKVGQLALKEIKPDSERVVSFNLPELQNYKAYDIDLDIKLDNGEVYNFTFYNDCSAAMYTETPPTIDGVRAEGEWFEDMSLRIGNGNEYLSFVFGTGTYTGDEDLSADIYMQWDEENFYMFAEVEDDVFCQEMTGDSIWLGDSIQMGFNYGGIIRPSYSGFTELGYALTPAGVHQVRYTNESGLNVSSPKAECMVRNEGTKTYYELKLPWNEAILKYEPMQAGDRVRFNIIINENDGAGRYGWIEYASGIGQVKNATLFGYLNLLDNRKK